LPRSGSIKLYPITHYT